MILPLQPQTGEAVADHYDELDLIYRDVWGEHVHHGLWLDGNESPDQAVRNLSHRVAARAGIRPGSVVCDVGCGYGATARLLADEYSARVTGHTLSKAQYQHAVATADSSDNPRFVLGDWLANDLPEAGADAVIAIESTEHIGDKARCFAEAARVLRPGGRLVVCAWLAREDARPGEARWLLEPICREGRLAGLGTESEYKAWIRAAGLAAVTFEDLSALVWRTWPICIRRFGWRLLWRRSYRDHLFNASARHRVFGLTLFRLWLAYRLGSLRYGLFRAVRPQRD